MHVSSGDCLCCILVSIHVLMINFRGTDLRPKTHVDWHACVCGLCVHRYLRVTIEVTGTFRSQLQVLRLCFLVLAELYFLTYFCRLDCTSKSASFGLLRHRLQDIASISQLWMEVDTWITRLLFLPMFGFGEHWCFRNICHYLQQWFSVDTHMFECVSFCPKDLKWNFT